VPLNSCFCNSLLLLLIIIIVQALQNFVYIEPAWVPGLPRQLLGTQHVIGKHWGPFIAVMNSRVARIRCTLATMDSNIRLTRDLKDKKLKEVIATQMEEVALQMKGAFDLMAAYIESPFTTSAGWKGDLSMKERLQQTLEEMKRRIESFSEIIIQEVKLRYHVSEHEYGDDRLYQAAAPVDSNPGSISNTAELISRGPKKSYKELKSIPIRERLGHTLDYYHRLYPGKTFCNLVTQSCVQITSFLRESIDFIDSIEDIKSTRFEASSYSSLSSSVSQPTDAMAAYRADSSPLDNANGAVGDIEMDIVNDDFEEVMNPVHEEYAVRQSS
jgi:hypothetical protein